MQREPPRAGADRWQKHYYRGVTADGEAPAPDHQSKLRLKPFDRTSAKGLPEVPKDDANLPPPTTPANQDAEIAALRLALAKREWLLEMTERRRDLAPGEAAIERRGNLSPEEFLDRYYAASRPVILTGEMNDWPALRRWTPDYLKQTVGPAEVEYQGGRSSNPRFEMEKDAHRRRGPFDAFIEQISRPGNDAYMTAYNAGANRAALAPLAADMGVLEKYLTDEADRTGMLWIGPAGTKTSLHHDLTNNFIAQLVGRKQIKVAPASEVGRIYNHAHVFSEIPDLDDPALDRVRFAKLAGMRMYDVVLQPGEIIFLPAGWWHQVKSLDFSVTATYTNFRWPNDAHLTYPQG
jgi:ribosomal protein L16 Arg81 hydroxylase